MHIYNITLILKQMTVLPVAMRKYMLRNIPNKYQYFMKHIDILLIIYLTNNASFEGENKINTNI